MRETRSPVWPLAGIVACLATLTVVAIWSWQQAEPAPTRSPATTRLNRVVDAPVAEAHVADAPCAELEGQPVTRGTASDRVPGATALRSPLDDLASFAVPRRRARPAPPVADRITTDPSLASPPLLPTLEPSLRSNGGGESAGKSRARRDPAPGDPARIQAPTRGQLARQNVRRSPDIAHVWPYAAGLISLLDAIEQSDRACHWSDRLVAALGALHAIETLGAPEAGQVLETLQQLAHEGMVLAGDQSDLNQRAAIMRATYGIQRRLALWHPIYLLARPTLTHVSLHHNDPSDLADKLRAADQRLGQLSNPQAWREYLLIGQLLAIASEQRMTSANERSGAACEFLRRLESADSTAAQEAFFANRDWQEIAQELRYWVCEPVDYEALLDDLERVEQGYGERTGSEVASQYQILRWSSTPGLAELGERINTYYRNANVRCAISGELLNRLLPEPDTVNENINDQLLGGRVFGRSRVTTRLRLVLLPDRKRWRLGLEARGDVNSKTQTKRGPARFHNVGRSQYRVSKLLLIDGRGVHTQDAEGSAQTNADLTGMDTDLDGVPLVNLLVRAAAKQMYDRQVGEARYETQGLVANRAESRMDNEVEQKLSDATNNFRRTIWQPLRGLGLRPEAVDMQTTETRLIVRYRLAGHDQVAAFTPRHKLQRKAC